MQVIPLQPVPSQTVTCLLDGQSAQITTQQKSTGLYLTLVVNGVTVLNNVIALNAVRMIRDAYLGFKGDLVFFDTSGSSNPTYTGLGSQYVLFYLLPGEDIGAVAPAPEVVQPWYMYLAANSTQFLSVDGVSALAVYAGPL